MNGYALISQGGGDPLRAQEEEKEEEETESVTATENGDEGEGEEEPTPNSNLFRQDYAREIALLLTSSSAKLQSLQHVLQEVQKGKMGDPTVDRIMATVDEALDGVIGVVAEAYRGTYDHQMNVVIPNGSSFVIFSRSDYVDPWSKHTPARPFGVATAPTITLSGIRVALTAPAGTSPEAAELVALKVFLARLMSPSAKEFGQILTEILIGEGWPRIDDATTSLSLWGRPGAVALNIQNYFDIQSAVLRVVMPYLWDHILNVDPMRPYMYAKASKNLTKERLKGEPLLLSETVIDTLAEGVAEALRVNAAGNVAGVGAPDAEKLYEYLEQNAERSREQTLGYLLMGPLAVASVYSVIQGPELDAIGMIPVPTLENIPLAGLMGADLDVQSFSALTLWKILETAGIINELAAKTLSTGESWFSLVRSAVVTK